MLYSTFCSPHEHTTLSFTLQIASRKPSTTQTRKPENQKPQEPYNSRRVVQTTVRGLALPQNNFPSRGSKADTRTGPQHSRFHSHEKDHPNHHIPKGTIPKRIPNPPCKCEDHHMYSPAVASAIAESSTVPSDSSKSANWARACVRVSTTARLSLCSSSSAEPTSRSFERNIARDCCSRWFSPVTRVQFS